MIQIKSLESLAEALEGASLLGNNTEFNGLSIDTRSLETGQLFVAIKGPHFDGHQFIEQARQKGAKAALVSELQQTSLAQIKVADTRLALGQVGKINRNHFVGKLAAITGSSGKTTTKEMLALICQDQGATLATLGNLNNDFGVPLTLSRIQSEHQYAVIELGTNAPGEILYTSHMANPDIAIINNVTGAHLQGFGTLDRLAKAKGEIIQGLKPKGVAVLNRDDFYFPYWQNLAENRSVVSFGFSEQADSYVYDIKSDTKGSYFKLRLAGETIDIHLAVPGKHQIANAAAAAAAAYHMGIGLDSVKSGLEKFIAVSGRGAIYVGSNGSILVDDTYNANPGSMRAAVDLLCQYQGEKWLIIGDMLELGDSAIEEHQKLGAYAKTSGVDRLLAIGALSYYSCQSFGINSQHFAAKEQLQQFVCGHFSEGQVLLFKASRQTQMETVLQACLADRGEN